MTDDLTPNPALTRRHILAGAGVIGAGLVAAACGQTQRVGPAANNDTAGALPAPQAKTPTPQANVPVKSTKSAAALKPTPDDVKIAQLAAGLEVLAVGTYKSALDAAGAGTLGTVPPAVAEYVTVAMKQHQAHLDAWNKVLTTNGASAVTEPNAQLKPTVDGIFGGVKDVAGAAMLALMLEEIAAATYLNAQNVLTDKDAIELAGSIQIIDAQHVSILLYVLGQYPVPDVFAKVEKAASPEGAAAPGATPVTMPATL